MESNTPFLLADGVAHLEPRTVSNTFFLFFLFFFFGKSCFVFLRKIEIYIDGESTYIGYLRISLFEKFFFLLCLLKVYWKSIGYNEN